MPPADKTRIQKVLSAAGVASRRAVEEMIVQGRVQVNGQVVTELPIFVDPEADEIKVDGRRIRAGRAIKRPKAYIALHKPRGVVCTQSDPDNRTRAVDLIPDIGRRVYCVGRLDKDSTGLIILTNDGKLTQHLTHPSHEVEKTYVVEVQGKLDAEEMDKLKEGVYLDGSKTLGAYIKVLRSNPERSVLEIRLREGRNREIRRMLARVGHKVKKLKRKAIGPITIRGLKPGSSRPLSPKEVGMLYHAGGEETESTRQTKPKRSRKTSPPAGRSGRGSKHKPRNTQSSHRKSKPKRKDRKDRRS
ncbi:MAG: pseudouridine synthase [Phycisphaerae bacterium]